jgi:hypothetical protein
MLVFCKGYRYMVRKIFLVSEISKLPSFIENDVNSKIAISNRLQINSFPF